MKFIRLLFCLLLSLSVLHATPSAPPIAKEVIAAAHKTTYRIAFSTIVGRAGCSGTAIAPHALLTATHCELGTDVLLIEGHKAARIAGVPLRDNFDHSILLLDGITFEHYASFAKDELAQGDDVFVFGNPGGISDLYRRGVFAGVRHPKGLSALFGAPDSLVFDFNAFHGDSGEAIFNDKGEIAGVTSITIRLKNESDPTDDSSAQFVGAFALRFTDAQLEQARTYNPPAFAVQSDDDDDEEQ